MWNNLRLDFVARHKLMCQNSSLKRQFDTGFLLAYVHTIALTATLPQLGSFGGDRTITYC